VIGPPLGQALYQGPASSPAGPLERRSRRTHPPPRCQIAAPPVVRLDGVLVGVMRDLRGPACDGGPASNLVFRPDTTNPASTRGPNPLPLTMGPRDVTADVRSPTPIWC
jgi:hypothetical protein